MVVPAGRLPGAPQKVGAQLHIGHLQLRQLFRAAPVAFTVVLLGASGHAAERGGQVIQCRVEAKPSGRGVGVDHEASPLRTSELAGPRDHYSIDPAATAVTEEWSFGSWCLPADGPNSRSVTCPGSATRRVDRSGCAIATASLAKSLRHPTSSVCAAATGPPPSRTPHSTGTPPPPAACTPPACAPGRTPATASTASDHPGQMPARLR